MGWDLSHEGCEESSQCRGWDAGVVHPKGKIQWHCLETVVKPWWQEEAEEEVLCVPPWWQMVHKARTTIQYIWQLLHGWLFHKWASFGTGRIQSKKTKQEQQNIFFFLNSLWFYAEWLMVLDLMLTITIFGVSTVLLCSSTGLLTLPWKPCSSCWIF